MSDFSYAKDLSTLQEHLRFCIVACCTSSFIDLNTMCWEIDRLVRQLSQYLKEDPTDLELQLLNEIRRLTVTFSEVVKERLVSENADIFAFQ